MGIFNFNVKNAYWRIFLPNADTQITLSRTNSTSHYNYFGVTINKINKMSKILLLELWLGLSLKLEVHLSLGLLGYDLAMDVLNLFTQISKSNFLHLISLQFLYIAARIYQAAQRRDLSMIL